ncbi:MAG: hypothetical protein IJ033_03865 [Clostridia bacterium]|nr:hypothetical protein [Clostridia bacterium]
MIFLQIGSFLVSIAPLIVVIILKWNSYTSEPSDSIKLGVGCMIGLIFIFLKAVGKLKMPSRIVSFGIVFIMSYLLKAILDDLILLSGMALAGEALDMIIFQPFIKKIKEKIQIGKQANATTAQVEEIVKKYLGSNGRV